MFFYAILAVTRFISVSYLLPYFSILTFYFNTSSCFRAMFFIRVLWNLSIDLRPQDSEGLKQVYGLKFFHLVEDEKPFVTRCYENSKDVIVCGHKIPMWIMITTPLASENIATMELRSGYSVLPYAHSGLINSFLTISFFPSKLN